MLCCMNWELIAPWTGAQVLVPTKFVTVDLELTFHTLGVQDYVLKGGVHKDVQL